MDEEREEQQLPRSVGRRYTAEERAAVLADVPALGCKPAAAKHGVPAPNVFRWAKAAGITKAASRDETPTAPTVPTAPVPPPRAHTLHRRKGWVASTVRSILHNGAYTGRWTFKRREWRKVRGTNRRLPRKRAEAEVMTLDRPHLRIVDEQRWAATQERLQAVRALFVKAPAEGRSGGSHAGRATPYLLSSIIVCDRCGAPMMISGGHPVRYYRCGDNYKRRTCPNALSVREDVARERILGAVRAQLVSAEGILLNGPTAG